jgi:hypothetical protein
LRSLSACSLVFELKPHDKRGTDMAPSNTAPPPEAPQASTRAELSVTLEHTVLGLLDVSVRYVRTAVLLLLWPIGAPRRLTPRLSSISSSLSNPVTFLFLSSLLCSFVLGIFLPAILKLGEPIEDLAKSLGVALQNVIENGISFTAVLTSLLPSLLGAAAGTWLISISVIPDRAHRAAFCVGARG